ncbi:MAG: response regulator [Anaerolineae bacterium]|nr:response regulator [Anaerolineae bacterium]
MTRRILVVDDDPETVKLIEFILQRKGYLVVGETSGAKALEKALQEPFDLIVLDVMMPEPDGFKVARELRSAQMTGEIPILFFTAKGSVTDKLAGFQVGGDDYLTKPIHPAELLARVEALLGVENNGS